MANANTPAAPATIERREGLTVVASGSDSTVC